MCRVPPARLNCNQGRALALQINKPSLHINSLCIYLVRRTLAKHVLVTGGSMHKDLHYLESCSNRHQAMQHHPGKGNIFPGSVIIPTMPQNNATLCGRIPRPASRRACVPWTGPEIPCCTACIPCWSRGR